MSRKYYTNQILPNIEEHLQPDERLLWLGRPSIWRMITRPTTGIDSLSILILGLIIALLMIVILALGQIDSPIMLSAMLITLLVSTAVVPALIQAVNASRTVYAITTYRAIIKEGKQVQSFGAGDITCIERRDLHDNMGDVIFKKIIHEHWVPNGYAPIVTEMVEEVGFFGVENSQYIENTLRHALSTSPIPLWQEDQPPQKSTQQQVTATS